jgi:acyl-CoA reductase-like NAD-dependent aldehyde dehydrogenase
MNKLLVALCAGAFALGSVSALAGNTMKPLSKMETQEAKAAHDAAKAKWAKMTPEEQAAVKKAAAAKNRESWTAIEQVSSGIDYDAKKGAADAAASKAGPAPAKGTMNTPETEKALKQQKGQ